jgi:3-oxoacyl-[acyl-carrier-protein] synthase-3|tara:strand:- start:10473 stop:11453 length:981 start_codon:yes stop_codon:yes gene_type:complete
MNKAYINRVENYLPTTKEYNSDLLKTSGLPKKKIARMLKKIGIKSRRIAGKNIFSNDLAIKSAKKILKHIDKNKIDYLIFCSNTPEYSLPTNACIIQDKLKLKTSVGAFDIILACSGYIYSLSVAKSLILSNQAKNILLITSDTYSKFIKKENIKTRILFGDGSSSTLISSKKKSKNSFQIENFQYGTDGSGFKNAVIPNFGARHWNNKVEGGDYLDLNGPGIYEFALKRVPPVVKEYLIKNSLTIDKIDYFVFHQANEYIINNLQIKLKIPKEKLLMNMSSIGNTSSSSIPIVLSKYLDKIQKNKKILLIGFGGGLSWGVCLIRS